jgi:hypothetical protein
MKIRIVMLVIILIGMANQPMNAKIDAQDQLFPNEIVLELTTLFIKYYPEVKTDIVDNKIHFEYHTRTFVIHEPLKTGEWQDPFEQKGPQKGGILCDIALIKGTYLGAAIVPQTFDKRYYSLLLMAPYSTTNDCHLYVHLLYPHDVKAEFLNQFHEIINNYGNKKK